MKIRTPALLTLATLGLLAVPRLAFAQHDMQGMHHPDSASSPAPTAAVPTTKANVTIKGEVIDMGCYLGHGSKGAAHLKCAQMCAQKGMPIGLLAADGTLYLLTMNHADAQPFNDAKAKAGQTVTLTGEVHEGAGMKSLEVKKIAA